MNRIDRALAAAREQGRAALIVFVTGGDPDIETTVELIAELARAGADVIEVGVPHSDPIAEGPTIQASSLRSLRAGTTPQQILDAVERVRPHTDVPLVLMGYLNNMLARGEERYVQDCAAVGVDGLIVADVPFDAGEVLSAACDAKGVHRILMVAPTSTPERVVRIAARSRGFVYCVAVTGVTGERSALPSDLQALVSRVQRVSPVPVAVGFGISTPEQAAAVGAFADGVIVGSALVRRIGEADSPQAAVDSAVRFVAELRRGLTG